MKKTRMFAALLPPATWFSPALAGTGSVDQAFELPFKLVDNRVFIDVYLNDRGPFHFIFDTGADFVVADTIAMWMAR